MVSHTPMSSPSIAPRKAALAGAILINGYKVTYKITKDQADPERDDPARDGLAFICSNRRNSSGSCKLQSALGSRPVRLKRQTEAAPTQ
jgi:hypothetical protein